MQATTLLKTGLIALLTFAGQAAFSEDSAPTMPAQRSEVSVGSPVFAAPGGGFPAPDARAPEPASVRARGAVVASSMPLSDLPEASIDLMESQSRGGAGIVLTGDVEIDFLETLRGRHEVSLEIARLLAEHAEDESLAAYAARLIAFHEAELAWIAERRGNAPRP
jgi:hypothetical protein